MEDGDCEEDGGSKDGDDKGLAGVDDGRSVGKKKKQLLLKATHHTGCSHF